MKPEIHPNSKQFWEEHVNQWNKTSVSQTSYCQEHGLSIKRFGYWKRKLLGVTQTTTAEKNPTGFIQIAPKQYPPTQISTLVIELPNQLRIEGITADNIPLVKQLAGAFQ